MLKLVVGVLGLAFVIAPGAVAQQGIDPVLFEQGQQLYQVNCALCHQDSGVGDPPTFPVLSSNERLEDLGRIVRSIHQGTRRMPPFPGLTAEEISSLANYIRNAWGERLQRCDHRRSSSGAGGTRGTRCIRPNGISLGWRIH